MFDHVVPLLDTWIWKAVAYAASQFSTTWAMVAEAPRSTCSHCGSLNALDQRVPALPSTAADAPMAALSADEAVAGLPCDNRTGAALAATATRLSPAVTAAARTPARMALLRGSAQRCAIGAGAR